MVAVADRVGVRGILNVHVYVPRFPDISEGCPYMYVHVVHENHFKPDSITSDNPILTFAPRL